MTLARSIADVLEGHFAVAARGDGANGAAREELDRYLSGVGLDPHEPGIPEATVVRALQEAERAGLDGGTLFAIAQAHGRGIGRITAAEGRSFGGW